MESNHQRLSGAFSRAFQKEIDPNVLETLTYKSEPFWDSLGHMALMAQISSEFEVELSFEEMISLVSFNDCLKFLETRRR
jgi:acyl carrier protein